MRKAVAAGALVLAFTVGGGTVASAQAAGGNETAQAETDDEDGDSGKLGLLGLVGLAGLAGLARRDRDADHRERHR